MKMCQPFAIMHRANRYAHPLLSVNWLLLNCLLTAMWSVATNQSGGTHITMVLAIKFYVNIDVLTVNLD